MENDQDTFEISNHARLVPLVSGQIVFQAGDESGNFYFLKSGRIKVELITSNGKSIVLYTIKGGETCALTTSCLFSGNRYSAQAVVEEESEVWVMPASVFSSLINSSEQFRKIVFETLSSRLVQVMTKIEDVTFIPLDKKLASYLLDRTENSETVFGTHFEIANSIASSREVVGRKLAQWKKLGLVSVERGKISILDRPALRKLAD